MRERQTGNQIQKLALGPLRGMMKSEKRATLEISNLPSG